MSGYLNVKNWRQRNKSSLIKSFGGFCAICKLVDHPCVYDFHHLDPSVKDFGITSKISSVKRCIEEAEKCVLLCSHCHRKVHCGVAVVPVDAMRFNIDLYMDRPRLRGAPSIPTYCIVCGRQNSIAKNLTCSRECYYRSQNKVDWTVIDLEQMLQDVGNPTKISKVLGVSDITVRKRLRDAGLLACSSEGERSLDKRKVVGSCPTMPTIDA